MLAISSRSMLTRYCIISSLTVVDFPSVQVPLEAILNYDSDSLHAVRSLIEKERAVVANKLARQEHSAEATEGNDACISVPCKDSDAKPATRSNSRSAEHDLDIATLQRLSCDDFDSGAETEREEGSQVTDMSESD